MLSVVTLTVLITAHAALGTMEMEDHALVNLIIIIIIIIFIVIINFFIIGSILIVMAYKSKQITIDLFSLCVLFSHFRPR